MRKLIAILFLVITSISYTGYYAVCEYRIYLAKEEAERKLLQRLPDNLLVKIDAALVNDTDEEELWYNSQMFDIVKKVSENGKMFFLCIADGNEAAAVKKMVNLFQSETTPANNDNSAAKIKNGLPDLICSQFYSEADISKINYFTINYAQEQPAPLCEQLRKIFIPPPRV